MSFFKNRAVKDSFSTYVCTKGIDSYGDNCRRKIGNENHAYKSNSQNWSKGTRNFLKPFQKLI